MTTRIEKLQTREAALLARVEKDTLELDGIKAELQGLRLIESVGQGSVVTFGCGRKENYKELTGTVLGVAEDVAKGKQLRVFAGQGFDAQTYTISAGAVLSVYQEEPIVVPDAAEAAPEVAAE